jgi:hypothetical protein
MQHTKGLSHMPYQTPEQLAAAALNPLGFVSCNSTLLPYSFTDKDGNTFNAMADLHHPDLDLYVEVKCSHLNGKTSKTTAENAYNRIEPAKRYGKNRTYYQIQNGWNHAASKQAIVQSKIGNPQFAIVFTQPPDADTLGRIERNGIQAFSLKRFAGMIELQLAMRDTALVM